MRELFHDERPGLLLGVAKHVVGYGDVYPIGEMDIFRLTRTQTHFLFPARLAGLHWLIIFSTEFLRSIDANKWKLVFRDEDGEELNTVKFDGAPPEPVVRDDQFTLIAFQIDAMLRRPKKVCVFSDYDGEEHAIGYVDFSYVRLDPLSPDQITARMANPLANKAVKIDIGCKECPSKLRAYTGLERSTKLEGQGYIYQYDLPDNYECECGKNSFELNYMRESLHGFLFADVDMENSEAAYVRQYGHDRVRNTAEQFIDLLDKNDDEAPVQDFLENNPMLFARFNATRIFEKPCILGKYYGDFAIVDSSKILWLIELERPSMKLFKNDGHPTAQLNHAYGQVVDWFNQFSIHRGAVLDGLGLEEKEVSAIRGVVIAGRAAGIPHKVMQRHMSNPPYPNIDFLTCDELATSLLQISKKIA